MQAYKFFLHNKRLFVKLAVAFGLYLVAAIGFAAIADEVHEGATLSYDRSILLTINSHATPTLNHIVVIVTQFGGTIIVGGMSALVLGYLWFTKHRYKALMFAAAVGGAAVLNLILKTLFERARPDLWQRLVVEDSFSFPSGHAMASSAFALAIVAILWHTKWRALSIILATIYIAVIGLSRLYLGVHYPTDILAGWLVSFVWVLSVAGLVYAWLFRKRYEDNVNQ